MRRPGGPVSFGVSAQGQVIAKPTEPPDSPYIRAPFQVHDLATLIEKHTTGDRAKASANFSEMGCYKTSTGLWLASDLACKRILWVTTKTGKVTVFNHAPYLLPNHELHSIDSQSNVDRLPDQVICVAHFNLFTERSCSVGIGKKLQSIKWDIVIVDEAHRLKNPKAQWTKNIKRLKTRHKHIMTGSGFINRPDEIWSLLNFLDRSTYTSYWGFRKRYCEEKESWRVVRNPNGKPIKQSYKEISGIRPSMVKEFQGVVRYIGVRRTKKELFKDLPPCTTTRIPVTLSPIQRRMYDSIKNDLFALDQAGYPFASPVVVAQLTRLRQICVATPEVIEEYYDEKLKRMVTKLRLTDPSAKLDVLSDILDDTDTPSVVFSNFTDPLHLLAKRLDKAHHPYIHLEAKDSDEARATKVRNFQSAANSISSIVFLSTIQLGGESITLTAADKVVFLDRSWSPAANAQAIARVDRPGQKSPVQVIHIEALKTIDQYIERKLHTKQGWFNEIFG